MTGIAVALASAGSSVKLTDHAVFASAFGGGTATARFGLDNNGEAYQRINAGAATIYSREWFTSAPSTGIGAEFEGRATVVSGTTPSGAATGTWLSLSSVREWSVSRSGSFGTTASTLTVEIRRAGSTATIAAATITLNANWEP